MQPDYIPAQDVLAGDWASNFSTLVTAAPATYGLIAGDAVIIAAAVLAYTNALALATDPGTRTPATIAAKDSTRAAMEATCRPYAVGISRNLGVTNEDKIAVGVNLPTITRTPIPAPLTAPALSLASASVGIHQLAYRDATTPTSKAKPFGAIGVELRRVAALVPAVDPDQAVFVDVLTKSPQNVVVPPGDAGKLVTYFARFRTRSGPAGVAQTGPWSAALTIGAI